MIDSKESMAKTKKLTAIYEDSLFLAAKTAIELRYFNENPDSMMRVRLHRGTYIDSMATQVEIPKTKSALRDLINKELAKDGFKQVSEIDIEISPYVTDVRNDWDTLIVNVCNYGVWGYLDNKN